MKDHKRFAGIYYDQTLDSLINPNGEVVKLRPKSLIVFQELAAHADQTVSRQKLFDAVWPNVIVTDDSLVQCIGEIRRALGDTDKKVLKTVSRKGYQLTADIPDTSGFPALSQAVAESHEVQNTHLVLPAARDSGAVFSRPIKQHSHTSAAMLFVFFVFIFALLNTDTKPLPDSSSVVPGSIAFSSIKTSSDDFRFIFLADQLSADIQSSLRINTPQNPVSIVTKGSTQNSQYHLTGTIEEYNSHLLVSLALENAQENKMSWAENWTIPLESFLRTESEILNQLSLAIQAAGRTDGPIPDGDMLVVSNIDQNAVYQSLFDQHDTPRFTPLELLLAKRYLEKVVEHDQDDAKSRAALAVATLLEANGVDYSPVQSSRVQHYLMRDYQKEFGRGATQMWNNGSMWKPEYEHNRL